MALFSIINNAVLRQNQPAIASVIGSPDPNVTQRLAILQDVGDELAERYTWQALNIPGSIVCDGISTLYPLPVNWGGLSQGTALQSTLYPTMPMIGPITNEEMAASKALPMQPLQPVWRIINNQFEFYPAPALGEVYTYNYYSCYWVCALGSVTGLSVYSPGSSGTNGTATLTVSGGAFTPFATSYAASFNATISGNALTAINSVTPGYYVSLPPSPTVVTGAGLVGAQVNIITSTSPVYKLTFSADTDVSLIDEKVLTSGLEWRWLKSKGLDYAEEFRRYEMRLERAMGRDDTGREINTSNRRFHNYNTWPGIFPVYTSSSDLSSS
jgi:hypothetical protein